MVSASIIAASLILNSTAPDALAIEIDLFGLQTIPITQLLGLTGYCIATILGLWLIFSIIRSGKL